MRRITRRILLARSVFPETSLLPAPAKPCARLPPCVPIASPLVDRDGFAPEAAKIRFHPSLASQDRELWHALAVPSAVPALENDLWPCESATVRRTFP